MANIGIHHHGGRIRTHKHGPTHHDYEGVRPDRFSHGLQVGKDDITFFTDQPYDLAQVLRQVADELEDMEKAIGYAELEEEDKHAFTDTDATAA